MNSLEATTRETKTRGEVNTLRSKDIVPAILYGGKEKNQKISVKKKILKLLLEKGNFLSNIITLKINGKDQNVVPKDVTYDILSDEPIHLDFMRVVTGGKLILEIPVKFINSDKSPGLKRGGVLNIVRRKVELKCPTENIPSELIINLEGMDIGESFKISSIKLPENVTPTIKGRDFVVATLAAPTIIKEPEKPAEETAEGAEAAEGAEGETKPEDGEKKTEGDKKPESDKKADGGKKPEGGKKAPPEKK